MPGIATATTTRPFRRGTASSALPSGRLVVFTPFPLGRRARTGMLDIKVAARAKVPARRR
jgi:hypothetical protein